MNNGIYMALAAVCAAGAYILSTGNAQAENQGVNTTGTKQNQGKGLSINNPGNLRFIAKNPWNGQVGNSEGYGIYDTMSNGVRAMGKQLTAYYSQGCTSAAKIITKYAPASENPTAAYIASVCGTTKGNPYALNVAPSAILNWADDEIDLIMAMIYQENGRNPLAIADVQAYLLT